MKYQLVFNGELTGDVKKKDCLVQLAELFGKDFDSIESELFRDSPIIVKRTSDEQVANRFILAFAKAGAVLQVEISEPGSDAGGSSLAPKKPEKIGTLRSRDTEITRLRPAVRKVELNPVFNSPKLSETDETRRRQVMSKKKDDHEGGRS